MYEKLPYVAFLQFEAVWWTRFNHQRQISAVSAVPNLVLVCPSYQRDDDWRR